MYKDGDLKQNVSESLCITGVYFFNLNLHYAQPIIAYKPWDFFFTLSNEIQINYLLCVRVVKRAQLSYGLFHLNQILLCVIRIM